jgi:heat-inducible transcriptional repressor
MITDRQNQILNSLIREYIKTAEPVGSDFLAEKYDFGICPSAIRIELQFLIKGGYLEQPHTSAGRIPTDKAYRLFVDELLKKNEGERKLKIEDYDNEFELASGLTKYLAEASSMFSAFHFPHRQLSWQAGWEEISREPEFLNKKFLSSFVSFLDAFDENVERLKFDSPVKVFIGKEIPLPKMNNLSLVCSKCSLDDEALVVLVGPKRMDYEKNLRLMHSLNKFLEELYD